MTYQKQMFAALIILGAMIIATTVVQSFYQRVYFAQVKEIKDLSKKLDHKLIEIADFSTEMREVHPEQLKEMYRIRQLACAIATQQNIPAEVCSEPPPYKPHRAHIPTSTYILSLTY